MHETLDPTRAVLKKKQTVYGRTRPTHTPS
jgi:hypothetical protein